MGLRYRQIQNKALVANLGWKIRKDEDLLWVKALKKKFLKDNSLLDAKKTSYSS